MRRAWRPSPAVRAELRIGQALQTLLHFIGSGGHRAAGRTDILTGARGGIAGTEQRRCRQQQQKGEDGPCPTWADSLKYSHVDLRFLELRWQADLRTKVRTRLLHAAALRRHLRKLPILRRIADAPARLLSNFRVYRSGRGKAPDVGISSASVGNGAGSPRGRGAVPRAMHARRSAGATRVTGAAIQSACR